MLSATITKENDDEISQSDCCGNGCTNCILDVKVRKSNDDEMAGKLNIIAKYCKFTLLDKLPHLAASPQNQGEVFELHFCAVVTQSESADFALDIPPGHHIMMRAPLPDTNDAKFVLRPYSPFWVDVTKMEFKILIDLKPRGAMSSYIAGLSTGDQVEFRGPIGGTYRLNDHDDKAIFIITQGVAIAPTIRIVAAVLEDEDNCSRIWHLVCCSDLRHVYFRERLQEFVRFWNYKARIFLTRQQCDKCQHGCTAQCAGFQQSLRYKESVLLRRLCADDLAEATNSCGSAEKVFIICGTRSFQNAIVASMRELELEVKEENIFLL